MLARAREWLAGSEVDPQIAVLVEENETTVQLVVRREGTIAGQRTLEVSTTDCREVGEAAALALAYALDDKLAVRVAVPPPPTPPGVVAPVAPPPSAPSVTAPPPPSAPAAPPSGVSSPPPAANAGQAAAPAPGSVPPGRRSHPEITVALDVGLLAVMPALAVGFAPALELSLAEALDVRASALVSTRTDVDLEDGAGRALGTGRVGLAGGRVDACLGSGLSPRLRLRGCAGLVLASVQAEGVNVERPRSDTSALLAPSLRADLRLRVLGGLGLELAAEGFVPVVRPELAPSSAADAPATPFPSIGGALFAGPAYTF